MRLSGKAATVFVILGFNPRTEDWPGAGPAAASPWDDASAWPVAREVPAGWCTNPTGPLARGMIVWPFAARRSSPPFYPPRCLGVRDSAGALSVCL